MKPLIERHHCRTFSPEGLAEEIDPFESLCSGIISQQVSGAAAKSIKSKFVDLFNETAEGADIPLGRTFPKPSQIVERTISFLRTAGLSERKAEYIKGLAEKFHSGDLSAKWLIKASDEEVLEKLVRSPFVSLFSAHILTRCVQNRMPVPTGFPSLPGGGIECAFTASRNTHRGNFTCFCCFPEKKKRVLSGFLLEAVCASQLQPSFLHRASDYRTCEGLLLSGNSCSFLLHLRASSVDVTISRLL